MGIFLCAYEKKKKRESEYENENELCQRSLCAFVSVAFQNPTSVIQGID